MVMGDLTIETEVLVIGSGPGGYAAAFRAADLGMDVTIVDPESQPGGECLYRGCIPSKTLLHLASLIHDAKHASSMGIDFGEPRIDLEGLRNWKKKVVTRLAEGLARLGDKRGIQVIQGRAVFEGSNTVRLRDAEISLAKFRHAILATGSHPVTIPDLPIVPGGRIMTSTDALTLDEVPESLLVIGGGYVGLELGTVYAALGSRVTLIELGDSILPDVDRDLVEPLIRRLGSLFHELHFRTKAAAMNEADTYVDVTLEGNGSHRQERFDRVLIAIGREPNSLAIGLETTGVKVDGRQFVLVDEEQRTTDERIFAVGDVVGGMMLAHKATREGKVAAEVIAGMPSVFDAQAIPAIVYTEPQVAWCGLTERRARETDRPVTVERFPWRYSGRALTMDATDGLTKIIADPETQRILGMGIVGRETEGMIAEGVLAVEMGALAEDLALSIHPHPTLSETEGEAAEMFTGSATHILPKRKVT